MEKSNSEIDPAGPKLERVAKDYINQLQFALGLNALLADPSKFSDELKHRAEAAAEAVIHDSYLGILPFNLRIKLPEDNPGKLSINWEVLDEAVFEFEASEVRRLDSGQVDFHNIKTNQWLTIYKHRVDIIPVFS